MKTLTYIKIFFGVAALISMLSACQKALNNAIPKDAPRRQFYNNQIIDYLTLTNDSLWVTQKLDKNSLTFKVGFDFKKDKTVNLYLAEYVGLTLVEELNQAKLTFTTPEDIGIINQLIEAIEDMEDGDAREALIGNPANINFLNAMKKYFPVTLVAPVKRVLITENKNTFDVSGDFDSSLTFFSDSFLSNLKVSNNFDFDFMINSYNRDSIVMTGYYTRNRNKVAVLKPIPLASFAPHFNAIGIIHYLPFLSEIRVNGKILAGETASYIVKKFNDSYDKLNKNLCFVVKSDETEAPEFKGLTALKVIEAPYVITDPKPEVGTVLARFIAYDPSVKGFNNSIPVEILAK